MGRKREGKGRKPTKPPRKKRGDKHFRIGEQRAQREENGVTEANGREVISRTRLWLPTPWRCWLPILIPWEELVENRGERVDVHPFEQALSFWLFPPRHGQSLFLLEKSCKVRHAEQREGKGLSPLLVRGLA